MAIKITELPAVTSPATVDLFETVQDPSGSPVSKKVSADQLFNQFGLPFTKVTVLDVTTLSITAADNNTLFLISNTSTSTTTVTLAAGSTLPPGFTFTIKQVGNDETVQILIVPSASNSIDYNDYGVIGLKGSVTYTLSAATDSGVFESVSTSSIFQNYNPILNTVIDTYTLKQKDNDSFIVFPADGNSKILTLPANASAKIPKGFHTQVYNRDTVSINISTTDDIEGFTSIPPNSIVEITKRIFGVPNTWVVLTKLLTPLAWNKLGIGPISMIANNGYINTTLANSFVLPSSFKVGDIIRLVGHAGSWTLSQQAGQTVYFGNQITTTGVGGSLASTDAGDCIELIGVTSNTELRVISSIGNITVT